MKPQTRLALAGVGTVMLVAFASPATAACSSPADVQDDSIVVYKCGDLGGAAATALHQLSNETVITKTDDANPLPDPVAPDAELKTTAAEKSDPPVEAEPEKPVTKAKPVAKARAKPVTKRKKRVAAKPDPSKTFHLKKKPSFGQRIRKFFRFGSDSDES